jgi:hypothetical protein
MTKKADEECISKVSRMPNQTFLKILMASDCISAALGSRQIHV